MSGIKQVAAREGDKKLGTGVGLCIPCGPYMAVQEVLKAAPGVESFSDQLACA